MYASIMNNNFDEYKSPSAKVINMEMSNTILAGSDGEEPGAGGNEGIGEEGM